MMVYILFFLLLLVALGVLLVPALTNSALPLKRRQHFTAALGGIIFTGVFGFYHALGTPQIVPLMYEHNAKMAEIAKAVSRQSDTVRADPKDLAAWVGLGQSYMQGGQYKSAANAFKQAVLLSQGNPLLILAYASAMISDANGKVTDDAKKSLEMVLLQQPANPEARYLMALRLLQEGKTAEAMKAMKELYRSLPGDSPLKGMIDKQIGRK